MDISVLLDMIKIYGPGGVAVAILGYLLIKEIADIKKGLLEMTKITAEIGKSIEVLVEHFQITINNLLQIIERQNKK